jgi:2-polyprenyl-6-methoxyphenol hydroxylase-like FAD-dependent oxidoreductase
VLVIGAGIAGLTLAGPLWQQGRAPVIVERSVSADGGYAIGLYPLGGCVLHGIGAYEELARRALALQRYELASVTGRVLQSLDMTVLTAAAGTVAHGDPRGAAWSARAELPSGRAAPRGDGPLAGPGTGRRDGHFR